MSVAAARRGSNRNEYGIRRPDSFRERASKRKALRFDVCADKFRQAWLVNRNLSTLESRNFCHILVDTNYLVSEIGDARAGYKTYITRTDHCDAHNEPAMLNRTTPYFNIRITHKPAQMIGICGPIS